MSSSEIKPSVHRDAKMQAMGIRLLPWESAFFGFPIAQLDPACNSDLAAIDDYAAMHGIRLIQCCCSHDDRCLISRLEANRFSLAKKHVLFIRDVPPGFSGGGTCRLATADDIPDLRYLAKEMFSGTRFFQPDFPLDKSRELYALWIEKAVRGEFDDICLVEGAPGQIRAFGTLRFVGPVKARIGLIGVAPQAQGGGLGRLILDALLVRVANDGLLKMEVVTQRENMKAIRLYARCGFRVVQMENWYYRWIEANGTPPPT